MKLIVNDMARVVPDDLTVAELLELLQEPAGHVLVEDNGTYIPPRDYATHVLEEGHRVEIILPAFGG